MKYYSPVSGSPVECYQGTDSGAYQLVLRLARSVVIAVGALGAHTLPGGTYVYTGRASRWLGKRIERHLRKKKRVRWHIDYLLQEAQIEGIHAYPGKAKEECSINNETARALHGVFPVKGFGSSDCRCTSHLMLIREPHASKLEAIMGKMLPQEQQKR